MDLKPGVRDFEESGWHRDLEMPYDILHAIILCNLLEIKIMKTKALERCIGTRDLREVRLGVDRAHVVWATMDGYKVASNHDESVNKNVNQG